MGGRSIRIVIRVRIVDLAASISRRPFVARSADKTSEDIFHLSSLETGLFLYPSAMRHRVLFYLSAIMGGLCTDLIPILRSVLRDALAVLLGLGS